MATNKELTAENKALKQKIRDLTGLIKEGEVKADSFPSVGYGVLLNDDGYNLIKLCFDFDKKRAIIDEVVRTDKNFKMFAVRARNKMVDEVVRVSKENNKENK